ncbi:hypothetical protein GCM10022222_74300 [Amycolatopsis ultiminotia]|uniref:Uncharacterized protein n=1 Tax=Amycolatopsis ultiminotia TaxID=543629 RepID=A0ABP6Y7G8_9PSEU
MFFGTLPRVRPVLVCFAQVNFFSAPTLLPLYTKVALQEGPATLAVLKRRGSACSPERGCSASARRRACW